MVITSGGSSQSGSLTQLHSATQNVTQNSGVQRSDRAGGTSNASRDEAAGSLVNTSLSANSASLQNLNPSLAESIKDSQESSDSVFAGQLRADTIVPREPFKVKSETVSQTEVVHEPTRHPQVGRRETNSSAVGQYAAIYNSTATALSRTSLEAIATERPRLAETRVHVTA